MIPSDFLEELRRTTDIVRYVAEQVPLRKAGTSWKGLCPFHPDTEPSFSVRAEPPLFHCFGCGVGGDVFKFVMLRQGASFPEAVDIVARHVGLPIPARSDGESGQAEVFAALEAAADYFSQTLWSRPGQAARDYVLGRGFDRQTLEAVQAGAATSGCDDLTRALRRRVSPKALVGTGLVKELRGRLLDRFRARLILPIFDEGGQIVAFAGRAFDASKPRYLNSKASTHYQKARPLYGANWAKDAIAREGAIVMEGYFDKIRALQADIHNVVAACGTVLNAVQARWLARLAPQVIVNFDQDAGGIGAACRAVELLAAEGQTVRVVQLPEGHDPDSFIHAEGTAAYRERLAKSADGMEWLLGTLSRRVHAGGDPDTAAYIAAGLPVVARLKNPEQQALWLRQLAERLTRRKQLPSR